jgi:pimeloyl-ACP methyl ester carboxylesterase
LAFTRRPRHPGSSLWKLCGQIKGGNYEKEIDDTFAGPGHGSFGYGNAGCGGRYRRILLVGHSMGTLFSLSMAISRPEKVGGLFLLAVPLRVFMKPVMAANALRVTFGMMREDDTRQTASRDCCGVQTTWKLWQYIPWIPRFLELFVEMAAARKQISLLRIPAVALQSGRDELVAPRTAGELKRNPQFRVISLPGSGHYYYPDADRTVMLQVFRDMCEALDNLR